MASHEAYLRGALKKYQDPEKAKRDILNAISSFSDLRPNLDTFVFNDGTRKELLCLSGTLPVTYKGNTYNIPVCLWLLDTHPYNPPMVYVKPTSTMQIKPGKHVDNNGKVYLPYLYDWKHPQSDLYGLIQILVVVFGEEPPVFSRSAAPPRPPYPPGQGPGVGGQTPYPTAGAAGYMPMPGSYPPASTGYQPPTSTYPTANTPYPPSTGGYPGYPSTNVGYPSQTPYPSSTTSYPSTTTYPPYPPGPQQQQAQNTGNSNAMTLSDEQIRASLLSAVEDKMKRRLKEIFAQAQAELDVLKKTQEDLNKGKQTLEDMVQKLEREQHDVERNVALLTEKDEEIKEVLSKMENREEVNIDDAVVPTAPLYRQLLNAFAEEQATEDAIYYLGEALRREVIDLDVFLKQVRELSRKQFMLRALMDKCRQKAGLPEVTRA